MNKYVKKIDVIASILFISITIIFILLENYNIINYDLIKHVTLRSLAKNLYYLILCFTYSLFLFKANKQKNKLTIIFLFFIFSLGIYTLATLK